VGSDDEEYLRCHIVWISVEIPVIMLFVVDVADSTFDVTNLVESIQKHYEEGDFVQVIFDVVDIGLLASEYTGDSFASKPENSKQEKNNNVKNENKSNKEQTAEKVVNVEKEAKIPQSSPPSKEVKAEHKGNVKEIKS